MIINLQRFNCEAETRSDNLKKRFLRVLCRAFVSGLAGNGEMSAIRLTGNFTEYVNVQLQVSAFRGKCFDARCDSHFPQ